MTKEYQQHAPQAVFVSDPVEFSDDVDNDLAGPVRYSLSNPLYDEYWVLTRARSCEDRFTLSRHEAEVAALVRTSEFPAL